MHWDWHEPKVRVPRTPLIQSRGKTLKIYYHISIFAVYFTPRAWAFISYRSDRSVLAKIRISAHNLTVKKGRYTGVPRHDRICKVCNTGSIENEQHFLLECPAYLLIREDFILKLEKEAINGPSRICFNNRKYLYGLLIVKIVLL